VDVIHTYIYTYMHIYAITCLLQLLRFMTWSSVLFALYISVSPSSGFSGGLLSVPAERPIAPALPLEILMKNLVGWVGWLCIGVCIVWGNQGTQVYWDNAYP
jgi:hypothetical protein